MKCRNMGKSSWNYKVVSMKSGNVSTKLFHLCLQEDGIKVYE